jgi:hypothetical protein
MDSVVPHSRTPPPSTPISRCCKYRVLFLDASAAFLEGIRKPVCTDKGFQWGALIAKIFAVVLPVFFILELLVDLVAAPFILGVNMTYGLCCRPKPTLV